MSTRQPLAVLLLAAAMALLLAASSVVSPAAAAAVATASGGARMVFVRGRPATKQQVVVGARGNDEWHHHHLARVVEDEVAPELGGILATNWKGGGISAGALDKNRPGCQSGNQCAARAGGSYTRGCTYASRCPH